MNKFILKTKDNSNVTVYKWIPNKKIKGVVLIIHGMAEHAKRYDDFASFLNKNGFLVYACDLRGHGETAGSPDLCGLLPKNGWELIIDDEKQLANYILKENSNIPLFILGHSMGSFITRDILSDYNFKLNGVIISGTGQGSLALLNMGHFIAFLQKNIRGDNKKSKLLDKITSGAFNKYFKPARTDFDWLTRNEKIVDQYIKDPYCGGIFSTNFFLEMFKGIKKITRLSIIKKIPKSLPLFVISGSRCPVGDNTKGVKKFVKILQKFNLNFTYKIYKDARHEILNEINKEGVYNDILSFLKNNL